MYSINYEKLNIDIQSYWDSNKQKLPKSAMDMLSKVKDFLRSDEIRHLLKRVGINHKCNIDFKYQGSYNEETANDYFRVIDKSDIDLICIIGDYTQNTECIIYNHEGNKDINDWIGFVSKDIIGSFESNYCSYAKSSHTHENYVEIFKFKYLKDLIFDALKNKLPQYFFENREKVIKIGLDREFHSHNIELILAGNLELHIFAPNMFKKLWKNLGSEQILVKTNFDHYVLKGYNIITSEKVNNRSLYFKEIPNFSNINLLNLNLKSKGSNFLKYVILYKNFIKIWNEKRGNIFKIDISSFHIESLLYNLDPSLFFLKPSTSRVDRINQNLLELLSNEEKYLNLKEINEIFTINRNTNYYQIKSAIDNFNRAWQLEWNSSLQ